MSQSQHKPKTKKNRFGKKKKGKKTDMEHEQMGLNKKQKSNSNQNARKTYFRIKSAGNARPEKMQIKFRPNQKGFGNRGGGGYKNKRQQNSEQIETIYAPSRGGKKKGDKNSINKILLNDALMIQKANKFSYRPQMTQMNNFMQGPPQPGPPEERKSMTSQ
jgi:hypothetical protein